MPDLFSIPTAGPSTWTWGTDTRGRGPLTCACAGVLQHEGIPPAGARWNQSGSTQRWRSTSNGLPKVGSSPSNSADNGKRPGPPLPAGPFDDSATARHRRAKAKLARPPQSANHGTERFSSWPVRRLFKRHQPTRLCAPRLPTTWRAPTATQRASRAASIRSAAALGLTQRRRAPRLASAHRLPNSRISAGHRCTPLPIWQRFASALRKRGDCAGQQSPDCADSGKLALVGLAPALSRLYRREAQHAGRHVAPAQKNAKRVQATLYISASALPTELRASSAALSTC